MTSNIITTTTNINNFDNYLISKLNTEEEKQFSLHFKIYLEYEYNNPNKFSIDFDDVWKWCQFTQKIHAKTVLLKHFKENEDYIIKKEKEDLPSFQREQIFSNDKKNVGSGGHNKETIMLTVNTFKEFCMRASTSKAKEIRNYYIKLEQIFFKYIKEQLEKTNKEVSQLKLTNNKTLKNIYNKKNVVYIMKLQTINNDEFIIKIGKSDDIKDRTTALSTHYGCTTDSPLVIMDVYPCEDNYRFEQFLHTYPEINSYKYTGLINNKTSSTEAYIVNEKKYNNIKKIIEENIKLYDAKNLDEFVLKTKILELQVKEKELTYHSKELDLMKDNPELYKQHLEYKLEYIKICNNPELCNKHIELLKLQDSSNKKESTYTQPIQQSQEPQNKYTVPKKVIAEQGPYVQVYDANDITKLLHVYNGITEAIRNVEDTSFSGIKKAHKNKQIYKGYRWNLVERNERNEGNENDVKDIGESCDTLRQKTEGLIAMLNIDKDEIENVFVKQKEAAICIGQLVSAMSGAIKYERPLSNKYFILWDKLDENLKEAYLEDNELPEITDKQNGRKVEQINPETKEVLHTYLSMAEVIKEHKISEKTIKRYSKEKKVYNGFLWNIITSN